jgi:cytochrome c-type biogenesis protein CcmE
MPVNKKARTRLIVATCVIAVALIVGITVAIVRGGQYYVQVSDLTTKNLDGKNVKVGGRVLGAIAHDAAGAHFVIEDLTGKAQTVKIDFAGQMPQTLASGVDVVVIGKYVAASGLITADQLQTKCPSKYQGQASPAPLSTP